ncbi:hypothetical protein [Nocardiopsis sp. NRRL B-16309]|uniref:hypothetical protein n=1 Tax=Nocardiopsis sp. NRRL B-16309 TaxID=1519494 RepID=UPI0006AF708E|nr:hypothetical protein [Nocardiopsis sp. NRRL B-16309]KOX16116.1 hypothetical protein ADL05_12980 [Nocardiopsis sp. NRRL B-16309]
MYGFPTIPRIRWKALQCPGGRTALLQTLRLSPAQVRRGRLLRTLEEYEWSAGSAARGLHTSEPDLLDRLRRAGLGALLAPGLLGRHRRARL